MLNLAIYDALNSVQPIGKPYLTQDATVRGRTGIVDSAVDHAAYTALTAAFPSVDMEEAFKGALALPNCGSHEDQRVGQRLGTETANAVVADRVDDGSADTTPYRETRLPGHWRPAPDKPAGAPNWGRVKPFTLSSGSQFRPDKPLGFTSPERLLTSAEYAAQVNEVKRIGAMHSTVRTADQTQLAHYWANDLEGTYKPVGQQYDHTLAVYARHSAEGTPFDSARLFTLMSVALADAAIAIWDSKYDTDWDVWRPVHAIHLADLVKNPYIEADPGWHPLESDPAGKSFTPNFPTYVSGHSGIAAAWAGSLREHFGRDELDFSGGTDDPFAKGVVRSFSSLSAAAREKADSRKFIGVHFEWDNEAALALGYKVADHVCRALSD
ncbi:vanadium-dependent haloperoxidase [Streptomyces kunmingensis]|uniref:Vanadium-dependent haloperoxidase n=1 Tax=Streptomyces kunmingensis TaxID=68225 RepID=A0ABU6CAV4_9ACTN|nr:vanadium-dependent haloperoxidase [Streptomyces kunmingensis]MEB3961201.1 vanadium-dependent haloperoxidase [Streptomyces kunmingensis]